MRKRLSAAVTFACLMASPAARAGASAGAYLGAGCTGAAQVPRFAKMAGHAPATVTEFAENSDWEHMRGSINWAANCWHGAGIDRMVQSVPMLMSTGTLAQGAAGAYDAEFVALGKLLVADHQESTLIRIGWEFNGDWYRWGAAADPASFVTYYRRIVTALRSVPGNNFKFIWNPALGQQAIGADRVYPGDDVVDYIGLDVYNQSWRPQDRDPATRWNGLLTQAYGLDWLSSFAAAHDRAIVLPEWGTGTRPDGAGGGDDPLFIANMAAWIARNNVFLQNYWDYNAGDFNGTLSDGSQPLSAAAYVAAFGTRSTTAVPEPATWLMLVTGFGFAGLTRRWTARKAAGVSRREPTPLAG